MLTSGILAVEYTAPLLKLAYNKLGELDIFILFGALLVMGSFYLFAEEFTMGSFLISLPVAFLITCVIVCNEIPDFESDISVGKRNLLAIFGAKKGYILYGFLMFLSLAALVLNIIQKRLPFFAILVIILYLPGIKALLKLKKGLNDIRNMIQASRFTITQHFLVGVSIILALIIA